MPVAFWASALAVLAVTAACVVLLYAYGLAKAVDESFFSVLADLTKSVMTKGFWK